MSAFWKMQDAFYYSSSSMGTGLKGLRLSIFWMYSFQDQTCFSFIDLELLARRRNLSNLSSICQLTHIAPMKKAVIIAMCRFYLIDDILIKLFIVFSQPPLRFLYASCHQSVLGIAGCSLLRMLRVFSLFFSADSVSIRLRMSCGDSGPLFLLSLLVMIKIYHTLSQLHLQQAQNYLSSLPSSFWTNLTSSGRNFGSARFRHYLQYLIQTRDNSMAPNDQKDHNNRENAPQQSPHLSIDHLAHRNSNPKDEHIQMSMPFFKEEDKPNLELKSLMQEEQIDEQCSKMLQIVLRQGQYIDSIGKLLEKQESELSNFQVKTFHQLQQNVKTTIREKLSQSNKSNLKQIKQIKNLNTEILSTLHLQNRRMLKIEDKLQQLQQLIQQYLS